MESISPLFESRSRLITFLSLCLPMTLVGEFLLRGNPLVTLLAMIPANTFLRRTFTWNIFTHMFIETDLFMCAIAVLILQTWGTSVVKEWGAIEVSKVLIGLNALMGVIIVIASAVLHPHTMWVYEYHCGAAYSLCVFISIMAHLRPEAAVFPAFNEFKVKHAPLLWCGFAFLYDLVRKGPTPTEEEAMAEVDVWRGHCAMLTPLAMWVTWFYIRVNKGGSPLHDNFYPEGLRAVVHKVGNAVGPVAKVFGITTASAADGSAAFVGHQGYSMFPSATTHGSAIHGGGSAALLTPTLVTTAADPTADRHKQIAREALAKRFGQMNTTEVGAKSGVATRPIRAARGVSATPPPPQVAATQPVNADPSTSIGDEREVTK